MISPRASVPPGCWEPPLHPVGILDTAVSPLATKCSAGEDNRLLFFVSIGFSSTDSLVGSRRS